MMADEPALLPLRMVNEFVYCPRLFWLEYVDRSFKESHDTLDGTRVHRNVDRPDAKPLPNPETERIVSVRSVTLSSEQLGITGTIDIVDCDGGEVQPVDYKRGKVPNVPGGAYDPERVQLCLQGLLLREAGYVCDRGALYFSASRQRVEVIFDADLVALALDAVRTAAEAARSEIPPPLIESPKCPRCSLVGICLPDETAVMQRRLSPDRVRPFVVPLDEAAPLYVTKPGAFIGKSDDVIEIRKDGAVIDEVRLIDVSHVSVVGNVQLSTQATRALLDKDIPIFYFSFGAWLSGMTIRPSGSNIDARIAQHQIARDPTLSLPIARAVVEGKIRNQRTMVRRALKDGAKRELGTMAFLADRARRAPSLGELLGIEGLAARAYFACFSRMLRDKAGFTFEGRNRRPPRDPVNAVLSFYYALLVRDCVAALLSVGLEPGVGIFHQVRLGRPSLALDLAEEFRPLIADSALLSALNTGELTSDDFIERGIGIALTDDGRRKAITAYERRMAHEVTHPVFGYALSYRRVVAIQARLLARTLQGDLPEYVAFTTR